MSKRISLLAALLLLVAPVARAAPAFSPPAPEFGEPEPGPAESEPAPTGPLAYTVVGTPPAEQVALPELEPYRNVRSDTVKVLPERRVPDVLWFEREGLRYGLVYRETRAPLVFLIAGTGASSDSELNKTLARALYAAGMHVVGLPSPTHPNFIVNASETGVPGKLDDDARDLYRAMRLILPRVKERVDVSDVYVTGYSLGAANAAWVARLDESEHAIGFASGPGSPASRRACGRPRPPPAASRSCAPRAPAARAGGGPRRPPPAPSFSGPPGAPAARRGTPAGAAAPPPTGRAARPAPPARPGPSPTPRLRSRPSCSAPPPEQNVRTAAVVLVGAGRSEVAELLVGLRRGRGEVALDGRPFERDLAARGDGAGPRARVRGPPARPGLPRPRVAREPDRLPPPGPLRRAAGEPGPAPGSAARRRLVRRVRGPPS